LGEDNLPIGFLGSGAIATDTVSRAVGYILLLLSKFSARRIKVLKSKIYERLRNIGRTMRDSKTAKSVSYHPYLIENAVKPTSEDVGYTGALVRTGHLRTCDDQTTKVGGNELSNF
jgi:hypothetical protein